MWSSDGQAAFRSRIFLSSLLNQKLCDGSIRDCEKNIVKGRLTVPICILGDPPYRLLSFLMKEFANEVQLNEMKGNFLCITYRPQEWS